MNMLLIMLIAIHRDSSKFDFNWYNAYEHEIVSECILLSSNKEVVKEFINISTSERKSICTHKVWKTGIFIHNECTYTCREYLLQNEDNVIYE